MPQLGYGEHEPVLFSDLRIGRDEAREMCDHYLRSTAALIDVPESGEKRWRRVLEAFNTFDGAPLPYASQPEMLFPAIFLKHPPPLSSGDQSRAWQIRPFLASYIDYLQILDETGRDADTVRHRLLVELSIAGLAQALPQKHKYGGLIEWLVDPIVIGVNDIESLRSSRLYQLWRILCRNTEDTLFRLSLDLFEIHSAQWPNGELRTKLAVEVAKLAVSDGYYREAKAMIDRVVSLSQGDRDRQNRLHLERLSLSAQWHYETGSAKRDGLWDDLVRHVTAVWDEAVQHRAITKWNDKAGKDHFRCTDVDWFLVVSSGLRLLSRLCFRKCFEDLARRRSPQLPEQVRRLALGICRVVRLGDTLTYDAHERFLIFDSLARERIANAMCLRSTYADLKGPARAQMLSDATKMVEQAEIAIAKAKQAQGIMCLVEESQLEYLRSRKRYQKLSETAGKRCGVFYDALLGVTESAWYVAKAQWAERDDASNEALELARNRIATIRIRIRPEYTKHYRSILASIEAVAENIKPSSGIGRSI